MLIVEHDMAFVGSLCDRVYVMDRGHVITCCAPSELKNDERVVSAYLGAPARHLHSISTPSSTDYGSTEAGD
jgi:branched-chain amino acid transport system ATP-binding protein